DTDLTVDVLATDGDTVLGVADVDVTLDPIEDILGDIDIDVDAAADLQDVTGEVDALDGEDLVAGVTESVADSVTDTADEVIDSVLSPAPGNDEDPGDTDLTVDVLATDGDTVLGVADVDVTLDPIEDILGDIDIDVDAEADLQDVVLEEALLPTESDELVLMDADSNSIDLGLLDSDGGGSSGSALAGQTALEFTELPEPSGSVSEGIGGVIDNSGLDHTSIGGMFG
ncbi:MAG: hypothetical protein K0U74_05770, partial [Alphaproteobacteria bacterium]|nr:hypothetical protein [Alphaproteobacteria bacterium]